MPIVYRGDGFRLVIYPQDHDPAHVHAIGGKGGGESFARIQIAGEVTLREAIGFSRAELRKILQATVENQQALLTAWSKNHE